MKQLFVLTTLLFSFHSFSCEVCGCSASGSTIGAIGSSKSHLIGMSFQGRYFKSAHPNLFNPLITERSTEVFYTASIAGKYQLSKRIQLLGSIPYHINQQTDETSTIQKQGLGDVSVSGRYAVIYHQDSIASRSFIVQLGVGLKAPTGSYSTIVHTTSNLDAGSGSWDFPFDLNIYYAKKKWLFLLENSYFLKTPNKVGYQFGNAFQTTFFVNKSFRWNNFRFSPGIGSQAEILSKDRIDGSSAITFNSGYLLNATIGINVEVKNFFLIGRYQQPLAQDLSKGYTSNKGQFSIALFYSIINKKK